jgi:hypothetical protein
MVVDASGPVVTRALHGLHVPGAAELGALRRVVSLSYANTVDPRVEGLGLLASRAARSLVTEQELGASGAWIAARERTPAAKAWILPIVIRIGEASSDLVRRLRSDLDRAGFTKPFLTGEDASLLIRNWDEIKRFQIYGKTKHTIDHYTANVPTTLGRISEKDAIRLVIHGYYCAMVAGHTCRGLPLFRFPVLERFTDLLGEEPARADPFELERL